MKALSIKQPWAGLIIAGIKTVENRSWNTYYSGPLAIVSTQQPDKKEMQTMKDKLGSLPPECAINGAILGTVNLTGLVWQAEDGVTETDHPEPNGEFTTNAINEWWNPQSVGFILETPHKLETPIPLKGRLGLFNLPPEILSQIA